MEPTEVPTSAMLEWLSHIGGPMSQAVSDRIQSGASRIAELISDLDNTMAEARVQRLEALWQTR